ncbi:MAG: bile acid:sodium symporter family protein [Bacteroidales bacterium]|jgi:BASS family bile acid:Na+ symporter|nr:bile acid:sodium symporter family protein [Bacteroidales bacterium]
MKKINLYKAALGVCLLLLVTVIIMALAGKGAATGPLLILMFIILSFAVKGFQAVKGLSFTMWMFTAVCAALFYPQLFVSYGNFKTTVLIVPLLQLIMFGMGSQMSFDDFAGVIKVPKGVLVGGFGHYIIMPLTALLIVKVFKFPPEIAAGIILVGCVPNGLASNVMSLICNANLVLAVAVSAVTTIVAPFVTPFLMKIIGGQYVAIDIWAMMMDIIKMMIFPIIAGFIFNLINNGNKSARARNIELTGYVITILLANLIYLKVSDTGFSGYLIQTVKTLAIAFVLPIVAAMLFRHFLKGDHQLQKKILSLISMVGIAVIVTVITAAGRDSLLAVGALLLLVVTIQNLAGYFLGYNAGRLFGLPKRDCRTLAFEVSMSNGGLASGLAMTMGNIATIGLAPAIYGPLMNVTGSTLASWWRSKPLPEAKDDAETVTDSK